MIGFYAGSFDPPTNGHLDIIVRGAALFRELIVAVGHHPTKAGFLPPDERVALLQTCCAGLSGVRVIAYRGATVHAAQAAGASVLVRGLRDPSDLVHESALAEVNRHAGLETIFLACDPALVNCSSSLVREILAARLDPAPYVPAVVCTHLGGERG